MPRNNPKKKIIDNNLVEIYFFLKTLNYNLDNDMENIELKVLLEYLDKQFINNEIKDHSVLEHIIQYYYNETSISYTEFRELLDDILTIKKQEYIYLNKIKEELIPNLKIMEYVGKTLT